MADASTIPAKEQFEESIRTARWQLGSVRLVPWIGVRDASFVSNRNQQGATEDDFTLTAGLGVRSYLPTGKFTWTAHALPEYSWWQDNEDKRNLNGRFGLGLFGHFNRMRLELSQRRVEQQAFFSDEVRELTSSRTDYTHLIVEVDVARRLTVYGAARRSDFENEEDDNQILSLLDREEEVFELGLSYRSPKGLSLRLGYEDSSADFSEGARNLSNSGTSELIEVGFDGSRFDLRVGLELRELEADEGSEFGAFDETTGTLELAWQVVPRVDLLTYARREQRFSVDAANSFNLYQRQGVRLQFLLGQTSLGLIGEVGEDEYTAVSTEEIGRLDDVTSYGVEFRFAFRLVTLGANFYATEYDSDVDDFDREITTVGFGLELGRLIEKLRLGRPPSSW